MAPRDPSLDVEPDFESEQWNLPRGALVAQGSSVEEAVATLQKSWRDQHQINLDAWEEHIRQTQLNQQEEPNQQERQDQDHIGPTTTPPRPPAESVWTNNPTPRFLDIRPSRHALKRLAKREIVELWHFTAQGCQDAANLDIVSPDETLSFVNTDKGYVLRPIGASSLASKVIKDEFLTFEQWSEGKNRLISCMPKHGWNDTETTQLAKFFLNLDLHPLRAQPNGLKAILCYQDRVRRDWTIALANNDGYAIGDINMDLMHEFHRQVVTEAMV